MPGILFQTTMYDNLTLENYEVYTILSNDNSVNKNIIQNILIHQKKKIIITTRISTILNHITRFIYYIKYFSSTGFFSKLFKIRILQLLKIMGEFIRTMQTKHKSLYGHLSSNIEMIIDKEKTHSTIFILIPKLRLNIGKTIFHFSIVAKLVWFLVFK